MLYRFYKGLNTPFAVLGDWFESEEVPSVPVEWDGVWNEAQLLEYQVTQESLANLNPWAVFSPTEVDLENSVVVATSLDGLRSVLRKTDVEYVFGGEGSHNGGTPIAPQELTSEELDVLLDMPTFCAKENRTGVWIAYDKQFRQTVLDFIKNEVADASYTEEQALAFGTLMSPVYLALTAGLILTAKLKLDSIALAGMLTLELKNAILALMNAYLNKFPR